MTSADWQKRPQRIRYVRCVRSMKRPSLRCPPPLVPFLRPAVAAAGNLPPFVADSVALFPRTDPSARSSKLRDRPSASRASPAPPARPSPDPAATAMVSFASPLFWQISYLVTNLNKKNFKTNVAELNQVHILPFFRGSLFVLERQGH